MTQILGHNSAVLAALRAQVAKPSHVVVLGDPATALVATAYVKGHHYVYDLRAPRLVDAQIAQCPSADAAHLVATALDAHLER